VQTIIIFGTTLTDPTGVPAQPPVKPLAPAGQADRAPTEAEDLKRFEDAVLAKSDMIGIRVSGPETKGQWTPIMQEINKPVPTFRGIRTSTPIEELSARYDQLNESRRHLRIVLMSVALTTKDDEALSAEAKDKIGRAIAWYLRDLKEYRDKLGQAGAMTPPNFLSKHLELTPQEGVAHEVTSRMLAMQYDITQKKEHGITGSPTEFAAKTKEMALRAMQRKHITIADAYACVTANTDDAYRNFLRKCDVMTPDAKDITAAKILTQYLKKHKLSLENSLKLAKKKNVEDMTVSEAIVHLQAGDISGFMQEISGDMKKMNVTDLLNPIGAVDLPAILERASKANDVFSQETSQLVISSLVPEAENIPPEELSLDVQAVTAFMRGRIADATELRSIETNMGNLTGPQQKIVQAMKAEIMKPYIADQQKIEKAMKTEIVKPHIADQLLDALFLSKKTKDTELREKTKDAIVRRIVGGELTTKEAFELFFWLHSPVKSPLTIGSNVISILENHQEVELTHDLKLHQFDTLKNLVLSTEDELKAELEKLELTPEQKVELRNAVLFLEESGMKRFLSWKSQLEKTYVKYPFVCTLILLFFGGGTLFAVGKGISKAAGLYVRIKISDLTKFASMTPEQVEALAKKAGIPVAQVEAARAEVAKCMDDFNRIDQGRIGLTPTVASSTVSIPVPGTNLAVPAGKIPFVTDKARRKYHVRQEANTIRAVFLSKASLMDMTKALKTRYPEWKLHELIEVMKAPSGFNKAALRSAVIEAGYQAQAVDEALSRVYFPDVIPEATKAD
jgi:hypothetical protein